MENVSSTWMPRRFSPCKQRLGTTPSLLILPLPDVVEQIMCLPLRSQVGILFSPMNSGLQVSTRIRLQWHTGCPPDHQRVTVTGSFC